MGRKVQTIVNADGSRTTTITMKTLNPDGSTTETITKKTHRGEATADIENQHHEPRVDNTTVHNPNAMYILSVLLWLLIPIFGYTSTGLTAAINDQDWYDYEDDHKYEMLRIGALSAGGVATICYIVVTPLAFCAAKQYLARILFHSSSGRSCFMIASWFFYGFGIVAAVALMEAGIIDETYIEAYWIAAIVTWALVGSTFMLLHMEFARRGK